MTPAIRIGTRGSQLALWQAHWVKSSLEKRLTSTRVELKIIKTKGDIILDSPLAQVGGKGLFVKEIEDALLTGSIDLAVHSMKDMPFALPSGLRIAAVPERETPFDVLISLRHHRLADMKPGARIGTSSLRRSAQLRHLDPALVIVPLRGNLDTRIRKLETENLDGVVLAAAGIKRLGLEKKITQHLGEDIMLPAAGQGALCIETRTDDPVIEPAVATLDHRETRAVVMGERAFLNRLEGGCQVPMAAYGKITGENYTLCGLVADVQGAKLIRDSLNGPLEKAESMGVELAERLLSQGAAEILEKFRRNGALG